MEPGTVTNGGRRGFTGQQALEDLRRPCVLAEGQVQAAEQQFRIVAMRRQVTLRAIGLSAYDRGEVVALVEMEQDVAIVQVQHADRREPASLPGGCAGRPGRSKQCRDQQLGRRAPPIHG